MSDLLLQTKLYIPPASTALVARPRLLARLQEILRARVTLVAAPAGFGKTTLVAALIAHLAANPTATAANAQFCWLSLDANDNDPNRFFQYWVAALQTLVPQCGRQTQTLLRAPQPSLPDTLLTLLLNEMATLAGPLVLVLDDYHLITEPAIHDALTLIIDRLPPAIHLLLVSRADPPLPLARWRVRGQLAEVRAADLRFTNAEAAVFFNEVMGLHLSPAAIATLETRTEGWIAALQLAALSLQGESNVQRFLQSFSGGQRYVVDYLVDEVLNRQPPSIQRFLLQTSILGQFCAALCDAVVDKAEAEAGIPQPSLPAQTILEQLERSNLFLIPLDNERTWYRYHALFAEFLRHRLGPATAEYHRQAAAWYETHGFVEETIKHTLAAQDYAQAATFIEAHSLAFMLRQQLATVDGWLQALPPALHQQRLGLAISRVWLMVGRGDVTAMLQALQTMDALLAQQSIALDSATASEVAATHALVGSFRQDYATTIAYAQPALDGLPAHAQQLRLAVISGLGYGYYCAGDLLQAEQTLRGALALGIATTDYITTYITLLTMLSMVIEMQGRLPEAVTFVKQAQTLAQVDGHYLPAAGVEVTLHALGLRLYECNNLEEAEYYIQTARTLSLATGNGMIQGHSLATLALIAQARGNLAQAQALLDEAYSVIQPLGVPSDGIIAAQRVFLWCKRGNLVAATAWAAQFVASMPARPLAISPFVSPYFSLARVWIAQERFIEAHELLADLYHAATASHHHYYALWALILQIKSYVAQGKQTAAQRVLAQALHLALPAGYIRSFIDEGDFMRGQFIAYQAQHTHSNEVAHYIELILAAFGPAPSISPPVAIVPVSPPAKIQQLIEPLSARELEVLQLLERGYANQAIADELIIALSTVKKHLINIYGKLSVNSRTQALTRARELQVL